MFGQLNALEAFCWIEWCVHVHSFMALVTLTTDFRGVQAAARRRGDGYEEGSPILALAPAIQGTRL